MICMQKLNAPTKLVLLLLALAGACRAQTGISNYPEIQTAPAYAADTGSANALVAKLSGCPTALTNGMLVRVLPANANTTTTPTLNFCGLGAKTITKFGTSAVAAGDLITTAIAVVIYDGTNWQLQDPATVSSPGDGVHAGIFSLIPNTTLPGLPASTFSFIGPNAASVTAFAWQAPTATNGSAGLLHIAANSAGVSLLSVSPVVAADMSAQYSKGSCTEVWSGSGTSSALTSGDDALSNNTCYNDSGVTRTITAVKCRSSAASNTTTVNPSFGSAGTGTTILSGALTCGSSYAYSSSGTVSNASWTTGSGIDPIMGGTLTGTSVAVIVEYTY